MIRAFSFVSGSDFNFFVASNLNIDLYEVKIDKVKAKLVKNITLTSDFVSFDPLCNTLVSIDQFGRCMPVFFNLYKQKQHKGKMFQLDGSQQSGQEMADNLSNSMAVSQSSASFQGRQSMTERAMSLFRK